MDSEQKNKRVVIATGGTGGHFYPAFSLGIALKHRGYEVLFLLSQKGKVLDVVEKNGMSGVELGILGMPRILNFSWFNFFYRLWKGLQSIYFILRSYRPLAVVGMGSYLSFPAMLNAYFLKIPSIIHEANASLGLANRFSRPFVKKIALGLPSTSAGEPSTSAGKPSTKLTGKTVLTGTPIRSSFQKVPSSKESRRKVGLEEEKKTLLVFGGSQGARGVNDLVLRSVKILSSRDISWLQILHLAGRQDFEAAKASYEGLSVSVKVLDYLESMELAYSASDLVVCRSGASTLAELLALKKPALLVPYPYAAQNHQLENARLWESLGVALVFEEKVTGPGTLAEEIFRLLHADPPVLEQMAKAFQNTELPDPFNAVEKLADVIEGIIK